MPGAEAVAVKPPLLSITTVPVPGPAIAIGVVVGAPATVSGSDAPSEQPARTPGVLTDSVLETFALNVGTAVQVAPAVSLMLDLARVTVAVKFAGQPVDAIVAGEVFAQ